VLSSHTRRAGRPASRQLRLALGDHSCANSLVACVGTCHYHASVIVVKSMILAFALVLASSRSASAQFFAAPSDPQAATLVALIETPSPQSPTSTAALRFPFENNRGTAWDLCFLRSDHFVTNSGLWDSQLIDLGAVALNDAQDASERDERWMGHRAATRSGMPAILGHTYLVDIERGYCRFEIAFQVTSLNSSHEVAFAWRLVSSRFSGPK
jgi:hypothetical protein